MRALALNRANSLFRSRNYLFEASFPSRIGTEGVDLALSLDQIAEAFRHLESNTQFGKVVVNF